MTSQEKLKRVVGELLSRDPSGPIDAMAQMAGRQFAPAYLAQLPDDPAELDQLLEQAAAFVLSLRSDVPTPNEAEEANP